jgi:hypothetical protein
VLIDCADCLLLPFQKTYNSKKGKKEKVGFTQRSNKKAGTVSPIRRADGKDIGCKTALRYFSSEVEFKVRMHVRHI